MFQGKYDASRAEAKKLYDGARNDGEKRGAMFAVTTTYVEEGKFDLALAELDKQYALGKGIGDAAAMAGDATFMGNVLLESGKPAEALKKFEQAVQVTKRPSSRPKSRRTPSCSTATTRPGWRSPPRTSRPRSVKADAFLQESQAQEEPVPDPAGSRGGGDDRAGGEELRRRRWPTSSRRTSRIPYNLYRDGLAYEGKGDEAKAKEMFKKRGGLQPAPHAQLGVREGEEPKVGEA